TRAAWVRFPTRPPPVASASRARSASWARAWWPRLVRASTWTRSSLSSCRERVRAACRQGETGGQRLDGCLDGARVGIDARAAHGGGDGGVGGRRTGHGGQTEGGNSRKDQETLAHLSVLLPI